MRAEIGAIREEMEKDHKRTLEGILNRFSYKKNPYFILVYTEEGLDVVPDDGVGLKPGDKVMRVDNKTVIRTKFLIIDVSPNFNRYLDLVLQGSLKVLGMIAYKVDNQKGQLVRLWTLPQDIPLGGISQEDGVVQEVLENSQIIGHFIT